MRPQYRKNIVGNPVLNIGNIGGGNFVINFKVHICLALRAAVIMPEWQGAGIGTRFLDAIGQYHLDGRGRCGYKLPTFFHTSHPQLCMALRRSDKWVQTGAQLYGDNKLKSARSLKKSRDKQNITNRASTGYGGHFRAVQAFKYIGNDN